jgi:ABC-type phosphate/phosphonate transport system substrate-binding protein
MKKNFRRLVLFGMMLGFFLPRVVSAEVFKIAIMQDQTGAAKKFQPLLDYLSQKGVAASFVAASSYVSAAGMFKNGEVDGMFSGSGVAGAMIIKELAVPVVRPVDKDGYSTYWAVIIAPKAAKKFTGSALYFAEKRVMVTSLASSGEFYFRSLPDARQSKAMLLKATSHGAAIEALGRGEADAAIVKNRVWDKIKDKYPGLTLVGEDKGENPDGTLIVSKKMNSALVAKIAAILLGIENDVSPESQAVKTSLEIQGYIKTTPKDFEHTLSLLRNAGVTKAFNFLY